MQQYQGLNIQMNKELSLRIEGVDYYIAPANLLHYEHRSNIVNAPSTVLNQCSPDNNCMSKLKQFLTQTAPAFEGAKKQIYNNGAKFYLAKRTQLMRPLSAKAVIEWLEKAEASANGAYVYLSYARNKLRQDFFDDNLPAAERYMEGYDGNYSQNLIAASSILKTLREIEVAGGRPFESIFGKNGSKSIEFV
jgi:hypothetical protein